MKVLHFYKTYFPDTMGGVEKVIDQIITNAARLGVESEVLTLTSEKKESTVTINGYKVHRIPYAFELASTPFSWKVLSRFRQLASKADVVHYHFPWPFGDLVHFLTWQRKPSVVTYHTDIVKQKLFSLLCAPLINSFLFDIDKIVATSPNYAATSQLLGRFRRKVEVISIGIDKASYPTIKADKLDYWRRRFPGPFFLFVGYLRYYKGLQFLIEAAKQVDAPIVLVGKEGPEAEKLKQQAFALGARNVHFVGTVSDEDKVALLKLCYAMVFPSHLRSEAFGVSLLEGAMFGKPLISCEIGTGTTYINIANQTGLVVPPADPKALDEAMNYLLSQPKKAAAMGKKAAARYQEVFTAEKMAEGYVRLYRGLLSSR